MRRACVAALLALAGWLCAGASGAEQAPQFSAGQRAGAGGAEQGPQLPAGQGAGVGGVEQSPQFPAGQRAAVRGVAGGGAALQCRVRHQGDRAVSWVRSRDLQILSHAGVVFTGDARVSAREAAGAGPRGDTLHTLHTLHTLRIAPLRAADAGRYECQLNTEPKMSLFFNLSVVEESETPRILLRVWGAADTGAETDADSDADMDADSNADMDADEDADTEVDVDADTNAEMEALADVEGGADAAPAVLAAAGGAARLACAARYAGARGAGGAAPALRVRWLRAGRPLHLQGGGGVSVETAAEGGRVVARVRLGGLRARDAGRYTCEARGGAARPARASLRVLMRPGAERRPEHMQRDQAAPGRAAPPPLPRALLLAVLLMALGA